MSKNDSNLVWIDLEMTGLDPEACVILEIATIVTDQQLNVIAEGPVIAIHQPSNVLDNMDEWCIRVHGESGLTDRCRASKVAIEEASQQTIEFLSEYVGAGKSPLCGNTIGQDRRFMVKYMPELENYFHYRSIDVSTIKELVRRWQPELLNGFSKQGSHKALDDIRESIAELQYYRSKVFTI